MAVILLIVFTNVSYGQDKAFFGGMRYDDGFLLSYGTAVPLNDNLWTFEYFTWGDPYGDLNVELAYIVPVYKGLNLGVLAGPNVDWYDDAGDGINPVAYLIGASGGVATWDFGDLGLWGYYKYKFTFDPDGNQYQDGYAAGGGLYVWF